MDLVTRCLFALGEGLAVVAFFFRGAMGSNE